MQPDVFCISYHQLINCLWDTYTLSLFGFETKGRIVPGKKVVSVCKQTDLPLFSPV